MRLKKNGYVWSFGFGFQSDQAKRGEDHAKQAHNKINYECHWILLLSVHCTLNE